MPYSIRFAAKLAREFKAQGTTEQLFILGIVLIAAGVALYSFPAGLITLGVLMACASWRIGMITPPALPEDGAE